MNGANPPAKLNGGIITKGVDKIKMMATIDQTRPDQTRPDQTRPDHPIVSFCIPVYNNAKAAEIMVKSLLSSDDSRFEVVVSDDNSRENVGELLSVIHDERFRYYRNEKNLGAHKNWEHSLELGRGEWLYLIMGRDMVHGEKITRLIEMLEYARENNITYIKDGYAGLRGGDISVYEGIKAMKKFVRVEHPSGDIYDGNMFRSIPERTRYFEISDMYPENYVRHYILLKGKGAYLRSGVYIYEDPRLVKFSVVKSGVDKVKNVFDAYFAPKRCIRQHFELIDMIIEDYPSIFTRNEVDSYLQSIFMELLYHITLKWRDKCSSYSWMSHYGHSVKYVGFSEIIGNIHTACKSMRCHLKEKGAYTFRWEIIILSCAAISLVHFTVKSCAKKILKPLGGWRLLKSLKRYLKS